jgi:chemotaxis protein MotB
LHCNIGTGAERMARGKADKNARPIIIKREEIVGGGHHGGAWKVAYADFVTAMMAFFLLMWLLNATTEKQRKGLADYFSPSNLFSHSSSGSGKPFGGTSPFSDGPMVSNRGAAEIVNGPNQPLPDAESEDTSTVAQPNKTEDGGSGQEDTFGAGDSRHVTPPAKPVKLTDVPAAAAAAAQAQARLEQASFAQAASELKAAVAADPALADLGKQLMVDMTPEGLRIQILDEDHRPMFATGSSELDERARELVLKIAPVLNRLSEDIEITGHTDAAQYQGADRTNWELSSERANATRRLLVDAGLPERRVRNISGAADRDPLVPTDPLAAANRRIAIVVLRAAAAP